MGKRLIDLNATLKRLEKESWWLDETKSCIRMFLAKAKVVDAVEVVRCKDCEHWLHMEDGFGDCTNGRFHLDGHADPTMKADDFCSCGERKKKE